MQTVPHMTDFTFGQERVPSGHPFPLSILTASAPLKQSCLKYREILLSSGGAAWFKQGDWAAHAELGRLSRQDRTGLFLGTANSFSPVGFLHVLNGCNTTRSFSWSSVPWPHLPLPTRMEWRAPSRRWRVVLKGDLNREWGASLFLRVFISKE